MLELSTKYALKALLYLASEPNDKYILVKDLSQKTDVPGPYLSKIIKQLALKGVVETRRGMSGGVRLPKRKKQLSFYDVCVALDDPVVSQGCFLTKHACNSAHPCVMHSHWSRIKRELAKFLQSSYVT